MPAYNQFGYQNPYAYNYYGNYYPATYVPAVNQNAGNLVPPSQPQPQSQQSQMAGASSIIWINNEKEAQMYPVAPNNAVTLWDANAPVVYLKQADATGKPTLKVFDLVERAEPASSDSPEYVTKAELSATLQAMSDLTSAMGSLRSDINAMKEDMYGLAGKKKAARKSEVDTVDE